MKKNTTDNYFRCLVCSKRYNSRQRLRAHLKKHLNSKIFNCPNCIRKFSKKNELKAHLNYFCKKTNKMVPLVQNEVNGDSSIHISSTTRTLDDFVTNENLHNTNRLIENKQQRPSFNPMEFIKSNYKKDNK